MTAAVATTAGFNDRGNTICPAELCDYWKNTEYDLYQLPRTLSVAAHGCTNEHK